MQRDIKHWYEPEFFWPPGVSEPSPDADADLDCYLELFRTWGFENCNSLGPEDGYLKIAIFATDQEFNHVAKQLPSGRWSSKGGVLHDFRHGTLDALGNSPVMPRAELVCIMRRPFEGDADSFKIEEHGLIFNDRDDDRSARAASDLSSDA